MQVLPDVLLFIALLTACTKNQEEAGKGCLNVKTELPLSSPQAHIVSTSKQGPLLSPKSSLLPRHPDLSRRIWNFFQSCEFCTPEISTWEQKGSKRTPSILWKGPGTWQAHLIFRLFILLRARCPLSQAHCLRDAQAHWTRWFQSDCSTSMQYKQSPCISCYSSWVLHSDRGCQ